MVVWSLEVTKDLFWPKEENEELLGPKVPYLSVIGALMYHILQILLDQTLLSQLTY